MLTKLHIQLYTSSEIIEKVYHVNAHVSEICIVHYVFVSSYPADSATVALQFNVATNKADHAADQTNGTKF